jgi:hypothetical protein
VWEDIGCFHWCIIVSPAWTRHSLIGPDARLIEDNPFLRSAPGVPVSQSRRSTFAERASAPSFEVGPQSCEMSVVRLRQMTMNLKKACY